MSNPKISVIVPVYNVRKYIEDCLDSLVNQPSKELEFIFVNDCSPADEEEVILEYAKKDKRIKYIKNPQNLGIGKTRQIGMAAAKGDYLSFVDSDDYVMPELYQKVLSVISEYKPDIIEFPFAIRNGEHIERANWMPDVPTGMINPEKYYMFYAMNIWCRVYRKDFLDAHQIKSPDLRFTEDVQFVIAAFKMAKSFVYLNYVGYVYRMVETSLTHQKHSYEWKLREFETVSTSLKAELERLSVFDETEFKLICVNILSWSALNNGRKFYNFTREFYKNTQLTKKDFENYNYSCLYGLYRKILRTSYLRLLWRKYLRRKGI